MQGPDRLNTESWPLLRKAITGLCLLLPLQTASAGMLSVNQLSSDARVLRAGNNVAVRAGFDLREADVIKGGNDGLLGLKLSRYGAVQIGRGSTVNIEKLPFSSYASDLTTALRLQSGYLHLIWKRPGRGGDWPMLVRLGDQQLSLSNGEYFFERREDTQSVCVADGEAVLLSGASVVPLSGPVCYTLSDATPPPSFKRRIQDFIGMRKAGAIGDPAGPELNEVITALTAPATVAAIAEPAPPVAAAEPPVQKTAAAKSASTITLNIASLIDSPTAEQEAKRLRDAGYKPEIEIIDVKGRQWYRVQINDLQNLDQARKLAREIEEKFGFKQIWMIRR